jgi:predicted AlkP superfamily pyrophosphatase or phosphodiesterase
MAAAVANLVEAFMNRDIRFLIVAFDGLRPDMVDDDLMPNLSAFCRRGSHCTDNRAVFPTETRVNQSSLITGCHPGRHGMVANKFMEPAAGGFLNTADFAALRAADEASGGILTAPSLGEILHAAGKELAVVGCGTPGGNRILHHRAEAQGHLNMSLHGLEQSTTPGAGGAVIDALRPVPEAEIPNKARIDWVVDAYMDVVAPERDPAAAILWFSDPDTPYHYRGIESAEAAEAIRHADAALGRLLQWREASGRGETLQIIVLSDHGHVATHGQPMELTAKFSDAGFDMTSNTLITGTFGSLYVGDGAEQLRLVSWLQAQSWCGPIFARDRDGVPPGALPLAAAHCDHPRSGDIVFVLARDEAAPHDGLLGRCLHDNPEIPMGCGLHGGLSPYEISSVLAFSGSLFAERARITAPTGIIDVLPTLLHGLGIAGPDMDGRVLHEAMGGDAPGFQRRRVGAETANGYRQSLTYDEVGAGRYLAHAGREGGPPLP